MNPPSEDIKDILEANSSLGLTFGTDLDYGEMADTPDSIVAIFDTGGFPPDPHQIYLRPTIQVLVRGERNGYDAAHERAQDVRDVLNGLNGETWNSARYIGIWATTDVFFVHRDDNRRPVFSVNFRMHRSNG